MYMQELKVDYETVEAYGLGAVGIVKGLYAETVTAKRAWLALGTGILAHEVLCGDGELLSEGADRALEKHKVLTLGVIAVTALHLANAIPEKIDPIHHLGQLGRKWVS